MLLPSPSGGRRYKNYSYARRLQIIGAACWHLQFNISVFIRTQSPNQFSIPCRTCIIHVIGWRLQCLYLYCPCDIVAKQRPPPMRKQRQVTMVTAQRAVAMTAVISVGHWTQNVVSRYGIACLLTPMSWFNDVSIYTVGLPACQKLISVVYIRQAQTSEWNLI